MTSQRILCKQRLTEMPREYLIKRSAYARIEKWALESPAEEICGLLLGRGKVIREVVRLQNVARGRKSTFEFDPDELDAIIVKKCRQGLWFLGSFHSHTSRYSSSISTRDIEGLQELQRLCLIYSVKNSRARLWRVGSSRKDTCEMSLCVVNA